MGPCWAHFSHFFAFLGLLEPSWLFYSIFFEFSWILVGFWKDFRRVWGGFWKDFSQIFLIFLENADFVKYSVFPRENQ